MFSDDFGSEIESSRRTNPLNSIRAQEATVEVEEVVEDHTAEWEQYLIEIAAAYEDDSFDLNNLPEPFRPVAPPVEEEVIPPLEPGLTLPIRDLNSAPEPDLTLPIPDLTENLPTHGF